MNQPMLNQFNYIDAIGPPEIPISIETLAQSNMQSLIERSNQRKFLIYLMSVLIGQSTLELTIALICVHSINIAEMKLSYTIPLFIIFAILQIGILILTKQKPILWRYQFKEIVLFILYTSLSTITISLFAIRIFENTILNLGIELLLYCNLFSYLQMLFYFMCQNEPTIKQTLSASMISSLIVTIIFISISVSNRVCSIQECEGSHFKMIVFLIFIFVLFLGYSTSQTISLFQILNGKFALQKDQYFIASILLQYNTLLPFSE